VKKLAGGASEFVTILGYGSLVNYCTHRKPGVTIYPFRLTGWQRAWGHCVDAEPAGKVCALTIKPQRKAEVAGAFVQELRAELRCLEKREKNYRRVRILSRSQSFVSQILEDAPIFTYTSDRPELRQGSREFPIWRSYLECVLAGFLDVGGQAAVRDFIVTTKGWEAPILDDRLAPKYMRATTLSPEIRKEIDGLIQEHELERTQFCDRDALMPVPHPVSDDHEFG
jgi:glutathione-specific gamma-glutamylcyclotransferase